MEKTFRYIPGFDGLRALAVLAVIAYHLNLPFANGGFLGVTVFFVLSGFLITSLLKWEWEQTQRIRLNDFWIRRAKRLLPAILLLLIALHVLVPVLQPELLGRLRNDTLPAVFYFSNWHYIFQKLSYFEQFESPSLLTHFWSLAIEEQFYIVWAVVILIFLKIVKKQTAIFLWIIIGAIISAVQMTVLYDPNLDPSRVYYGTDTRIFSLLIGASFAFITPNFKKWVWELLGVVGLCIFLFMVVFSNQYSSFVYQGGMALLSLTTASLILSLSQPHSFIANHLLEWKPFKWIGVRSYGIYLWHYPVILLMNSDVNTGGINPIKMFIGVALIFLIASLSYTFIEKPIRLGHFKGKYSLAIITTVCAFGMLTNSMPVTNQTVLADTSRIIQNDDIKVISHPAAQNSTNVPSTKTNNQQPSVPTNHQLKITAIGDSVLINPTPYIKAKLPNITIDAKVSRQMRDAGKIVAQLKKTNQLGELVIIELGTNGSFSEKTLRDLVVSVGKNRKVLLINVRVPRPWESIVNKSLINVSKKYKYITIVDWYATSANHNEYFVKDGVHLNQVGAKAYAKMVESAVKKVHP